MSDTKGAQHETPKSTVREVPGKSPGELPGKFEEIFWEGPDRCQEGLGKSDSLAATRKNCLQEKDQKSTIVNKKVTDQKILGIFFLKITVSVSNKLF